MKLREFRNELRLTQKEMAAIITAAGYSITQVAYSKVEIGKSNPTYGLMKAVRDAFPIISIDEIFFDE